MKLDLTLDEVANASFFTMYYDQIKQMTKTTHFNEEEVRSLMLVYHKFVLNNDKKKMSYKQLYNLFFHMLKIYNVMLIDRIVFIASEEEERPVTISAKTFINIFALIFSSKPKEKFVFSVYDIKGTGYISRNEVKLFVDDFFDIEDEDTSAEYKADMVELLMKKFDADKDGAISFAEYLAVVKEQPMLLEFLGNCLPHSLQIDVAAFAANIVTKLKLDCNKMVVHD